MIFKSERPSFAAPSQDRPQRSQHTQSVYNIERELKMGSCKMLLQGEETAKKKLYNFTAGRPRLCKKPGDREGFTEMGVIKSFDP